MYTGMEAQLGVVEDEEGFVGELGYWYQIPLKKNDGSRFQFRTMTLSVSSCSDIKDTMHECLRRRSSIMVTMIVYYIICVTLDEWLHQISSTCFPHLVRVLPKVCLTFKNKVDAVPAVTNFDLRMIH